MIKPTIAGILLSLSLSALAEKPIQCSDHPLFDSEQGGASCRGVYAGLGLGIAFLKPELINSDEQLNSSISLLLPTVYLGYDINHAWAAELHFSRQGTATFESGIGIDYSYVGFSGLYHFKHHLSGENLFNNTNAYLKAGVGSIMNSLSSEADNGIPTRVEALTSVQAHFGLGLEHNLANDLGFRAEFSSYDKDSAELSFSVLKRFGRQVAPVQIPEVVVPVPVPDICHAPTGVLEGVEFISDSANLTDAAKLILDDILSQLQPFPKVELEIRAHTDSEDTPAYNLRLSEQRSATVSDYLKAGGIQTIRALHFGETQPIASNATEAGRAKNRRVELEILSNECD